MRDLERELRALELDWPATPDLASTVSARVAQTPARPSGRWRRSRVLARPALAFAAALLLLAGAAFAAVPDAREAVLDFFGLRGVRVQTGPVTAPPVNRSGLGEELDLGRRVTLAQARRGAGLDLTPPPELGDPDAIWLGDGRVSLVYGERLGIPRSPETGVAVLITVLRGSFTPGVEKTVGQGRQVERLQIDGQPAMRITGKEHGVAFVTEAGDFVFEPQRLAGPTLLAERGGLLLRVEGRISRERAVQVVRSASLGASRAARSAG